VSAISLTWVRMQGVLVRPVSIPLPGYRDIDCTYEWLNWQMPSYCTQKPICDQGCSAVIKASPNTCGNCAKKLDHACCLSTETCALRGWGGEKGCHTSNPSSSSAAIIQCHAGNSCLMASVLPHYLPCPQIPQPRRVIGTGSNEVTRICRKYCVPHPLAMLRQ